MEPAKIAPMRGLVSIFIIRLPRQHMRGQDELNDVITLLHFLFYSHPRRYTYDENGKPVGVVG